MPPRNIEDTLIPTTVNETVLINRIRELQRIAWDQGRFGLVTGPLDPNGTPIEIRAFTPTLSLAASAEAALEIPRGLRIEAHTHGPNRIGVANYVSLEDLNALKFFDEAQLLSEVHKRVVHQAAALVQDHFKKQAEEQAE